MATLLAWAGFGAAAPAMADPYTVSGVSVDVTAESAVVAREQAIRQAQQDGLRLLLQRLTLPEYYDRLPDVARTDLDQLVVSYGVETERVAADRYLASIAVTYDEANVQNLLRGTGVPFALELPPPLLVLPAIADEGRLQVFDGDPRWRDAWAAEAGRNTLLDIRLPLGDLADIRAAGEAALEADPAAALAALSERHETDSALLVIARPDEPADPSRLDVTVGAGHRWQDGLRGISVTAGSDTENLWQDGVRRFLAAVENEWKADNLVAFDTLNRLPVAVELSGIEDWATIRRRLGEIAVVRGVDVQLFARDRAELELHHIGSAAQLARALEARGLALVQGLEGWWLQRTDARRAG